MYITRTVSLDDGGANVIVAIGTGGFIDGTLRAKITQPPIESSVDFRNNYA